MIVGAIADAEVVEIRPPEFSDDALALDFAERHADRLRHVATLGKWLVWDGARWKADETVYAFDLARDLCREAAAKAGERLGKNIAAAKTVAAVEKMAKSDRRIAATADQFDADPWLLNTPGGAVNLKTGQMRQHRPDDYMTRMTAVAPEGDCPRWLAFLDQVTGGDTDLQKYLQRLAGYALTGSTREHAMAFLYGTGGNGKSVFLNTLGGIMGDYHAPTPIETFTASNNDRHPTEIARLRGARLVIANETEEGKPWAEAKIKSLTGGDRIAARFMRADFFEFTPQFKLLVAGNHRPGLRTVDEAIRRRFHLIPFTVTIPPERRDETLPEKLREEWPGILQWMIHGCTEWQCGGLRPPEAVQAATRNYLESEDAIGTWIDEACIRDAKVWESSGNLFASWCAWAAKAGEPAGTKKRFTQALATRDLTPERRHSGRGYLGLAIKRGDMSGAYWNQ